VDVFFRIGKGDARAGLNAARDEILRRHVTRPGYRVVDIPEPPRDRSPSLTADGYQDAVHDWYEAGPPRSRARSSTSSARTRPARSWSGAIPRSTTRCSGSSTGFSRSAWSPSSTP
jgi:hypothetical protein